VAFIGGSGSKAWHTERCRRRLIRASCSSVAQRLERRAQLGKAARPRRADAAFGDAQPRGDLAVGQRLVLQEQQLEELARAGVDAVERAAQAVVFLQLAEQLLGQRAGIGDALHRVVGVVVPVARREVDEAPARLEHPQRLALRGGDQPGAHAGRVVDAVEVLEQAGETRLEDVGRRVVAQTGTARHGVDEPLVAPHQQAPGGLAAGAALRHELGVGRLVGQVGHVGHAGPCNGKGRR
jgi:hypothetical protein